MIITPRYYQYAAVNAVVDAILERKGYNPVAALPTGTGKSIGIAMTCFRLMSIVPTTRILMLTHVEELVANNYDDLKAYWPDAPVGIYHAGLRRKEIGYPIIYGGCDSVVACPEAFGHRDFIIIDEAHMLTPNEEQTYGKIITALRLINPNLVIIGYSATPYRAGTGMITDGPYFNYMAHDLTSKAAFNRLLAEGYMKPLVPKGTSTLLTTEGVGTKTPNGEYKDSDLIKKNDTTEINERCCLEMFQRGQDRNRWLVFAVGIHACEEIADILNYKYNIPTVAIHSKMRKQQRQHNYQMFKSGQVRCAVNKDIMTTGTNVPEIDMIGYMRPTRSIVLWVQSLGRGTRPTPVAKDCLVLDFAGNTAELGPINDPRIPRPKTSSGPPPMKICPNCGTYVYAGTRFCPDCGHEFEFGDGSDKLTHTPAGLELIAADKEETKDLRWFDVSFLNCMRHTKEGRPPSLRMTFRCGAKTFDDWFLFAHNGPLATAARHKWRALTGDEFAPANVEQALARESMIRKPKRIQVWIKKPYPEIIGYDMNGMI